MVKDPYISVKSETKRGLGWHAINALTLGQVLRRADRNTMREARIRAHIRFADHIRRAEPLVGEYQCEVEHTGRRMWENTKAVASITPEGRSYLYTNSARKVLRG